MKITSSVGDLNAVGVATKTVAGGVRGEQLTLLTLTDVSFQGANITATVTKKPGGDGLSSPTLGVGLGAIWNFADLWFESGGGRSAILKGNGFASGPSLTLAVVGEKAAHEGLGAACGLERG